MEGLSDRLTVRFSERDLEAVRRVADDRGVSTGSFVRRAALEATGRHDRVLLVDEPIVRALGELRDQARRIGANLNQLVLMIHRLRLTGVTSFEGVESLGEEIRQSKDGLDRLIDEFEARRGGLAREKGGLR